MESKSINDSAALDCVNLQLREEDLSESATLQVALGIDLGTTHIKLSERERTCMELMMRR